MRIVFDINAGTRTDRFAEDILCVLYGLKCADEHILLPSPDMFSAHPILERRYRTLVYALAGDYLSDEKWLRLFSLISIDISNQDNYKGMAIYYEDWWREAQAIAVGAVSSARYSLPLNELISEIRKRYMQCKHGDSCRPTSVEWLAYDSSPCDIYSEDNGRIVMDDEIGSRRILSILATRSLAEMLSSSLGDMLNWHHDEIKTYIVDSFVFDDDDDDEGDEE